MIRPFQQKLSPRFSLRALLAIVVVAAVGCVIAMNFDGMLCRLKYGTPVDLSLVEVVGINDDALMLRIDEKRVHTFDSENVALMKWNAISGNSDSPVDISVNGVWQSRAETYTVKIGDEYVATR